MESLHRERELANARENNNYDEAAAAVASITKECLGKQDSNCHNRSSDSNIASSLSFKEFVSDDDIKKSAGEILNGIRRDVEVQAINSLINTYGDAFLEG